MMNDDDPQYAPGVWRKVEPSPTGRFFAMDRELLRAPLHPVKKLILMEMNYRLLSYAEPATLEELADAIYATIADIRHHLEEMILDGSLVTDLKWLDKVGVRPETLEFRLPVPPYDGEVEGEPACAAAKDGGRP